MLEANAWKSLGRCRGHERVGEDDQVVSTTAHLLLLLRVLLLLLPEESKIYCCMYKSRAGSAERERV
jgi:hypothetical protein